MTKNFITTLQNFSELLHVWVANNLSLNIEVGAGLIFLVVIVIILIIIFRWLWRGNLIFHETELNIALGNIGDIKIKSNHEVAQIAHKAWSELITRKAGLPFDPEHDVICEIYSSWYQLFGEMRSLIKQIPACYLKDKNTKKLIDLLVDSLNKGLRPHLTKWQAKFKRWYEIELQKPRNKNKTPQEIQRGYPQYKNLIQDLVSVNKQLVSYTAEIKKLNS